MENEVMDNVNVTEETVTEEPVVEETNEVEGTDVRIVEGRPVYGVLFDGNFLAGVITTIVTFGLVYAIKKYGRKAVDAAKAWAAKRKQKRDLN